MESGRARRTAILVGALVFAGALTVIVLTSSRTHNSDKEMGPQALIWRHELASIAGGGTFGLDQFAPLAERLIAINARWDQANERPAGILISSTNGVTWDEVDGPISAVTIAALSVVDGEAWAFGHVAGPKEPEQQVWRSADGITWTRIEGVAGLELGLGDVYRVAGAGSTLVALARRVFDAESFDGLLLRSDDGRDWRPIKQPRDPSYGIRSMTGGATGFVVVHAFEDGRGAQFGDAWFSVDGQRWSQHPMAGPGVTLNFNDVAIGPAGFAVVGITQDQAVAGFAPGAWFSPNGMFWEPAPILDSAGPQAGRIELAVPVGSGFAGFGSIDTSGSDVPTAWISVDGRKWGRLSGWPGGTGEFVDGAVAWNDRVIVTGESVDGDGNSRPVVWIGEAAN